MTRDENTKCHAIIHSASVAAAGGGALPIPGPDTIPITVAQIGMVVSLGQVFDKALTELEAKDFIGTFSAALSGRLIAKGLTTWIPGLGTAINAAVAGLLTEWIGWYAAEQFDKEREVLDAVKN